MVPTTLDARLDHVRRELVGSGTQLTHLLGGRHASTVSRESVTEHVGHDAEIGLIADGTPGGGDGADVASRTDEFGMSVAHVLLTEPARLHLVDEHPTGETVVDDAASLLPTTQCTSREAHAVTG